MRIALIISSLAAGGAERVLSLMANWWAEQGNDITVITIAGVERDFYNTDASITRVALDLMHDRRNALDAIRANINRVRALRKAVQEAKPHVVISFVDITNILVILATRGLGIPVIISERTSPKHFAAGRIATTLRPFVYPRASMLVMQSEALRSWGEKVMHWDTRVTVIANPVLSASSSEASRQYPPIWWRADRKHILAIGRLDPGKGFDMLLEAFHRALGDNPQWDLVIIGEGPSRRNLEDARSRLGLGKRAFFPGRIEHPWDIGSKAEIFVLSSRYEGFPNVLLEAMVHGLACISFDCPVGPGQIVRDNHDALLVPPENVDALAAAINRVANSDEHRHRLGSAARKSVQRFDPVHIMRDWDDMIEKITELRPA